MKIKLSDYIMQFIANQGVKHVFMLPGGGAMHLVDSLGCCSELEYIPLLHEQTCAIAAEAYAKVTDNLGVLLVTTGPGGTNAITGVAGAWLDSTPCLVLSGQVKRSDMKKTSGVRQMGMQELDIVSIVKPITKYAVTVEEPNTIRYHLEQAVYLAMRGRKGPVWLDIPLDVQAAVIDTDELKGFEASGLFSEFYDVAEISAFVSQTVELLNQAKRPVLLAGQGIRRSGAADKFLPFVKKLGIPVLTTWPGAELLPDAHPLNFGRPGMIASRGANFTLQNADCVITIGARLDATVIGYDHDNFASMAKKIIVDIDTHEIDKIKTKVDVHACCDAGCFIAALADKTDELANDRWEKWITQCRQWKEKYPITLPEYSQEGTYVNMYHFVEVLSEELEEDELIIPGSSGAALDIFWLTFRIKQGQHLFSTAGLGAMGFGIPASIGGCIGSGRKRVITLNGDGGFHLNIQELASVVSHKLPIKYFVLNNQGYAAIRNTQRTHFKGNLVACDTTSKLVLPDIVKIASTYGLTACRITNHQDIKEKIREILNCDGPVLCEVMLDPDLQAMPRVVSEVSEGGSMRSKPLEDLWPFLERQEFNTNMLIDF